MGGEAKGFWQNRKKQINAVHIVWVILGIISFKNVYISLSALPSFIISRWILSDIIRKEEIIKDRKKRKLEKKELNRQIILENKKRKELRRFGKQY